MSRKLSLDRAKKKYSKTIKGKVTSKRYANSIKGKAAAARGQSRYEKTPKGKAARAAFNAKRRAFSKSVIGNFSDSEWQLVLEAHDFRCRYCGTNNQKLTRDHVIPVSKGGQHTAENIVPACQSCNSRKGARIVVDIPVQLCYTKSLFIL